MVYEAAPFQAHEPELVEKILAGEKTETRRPAKDGSCRYVVGRDYAVQPGRTQGGVARIRVLEVRLEPLCAMMLASVRREGFVSFKEFREYWTMLHGSYSPLQQVWVIRFEMVER